MKLEKIKCKPLERVKKLCISKSYIIGCTGQKAIILDKQLNLVHTVENLNYVYTAQISPDESKLLLISNGNQFYIVDMQTFDVKRVTVKAPYNGNLEGRGCWSFDGKSVWIPLQRRTDYINSTLRRYSIENLSDYQNYLEDKYNLDDILKIDACEKYLLLGYNRKENNKRYFIYFDGVEFQEFPVDLSVTMIAPTTTVDMEKGIVTIASIAGCRQFTLEGKFIRTISHPEPKDKMLCFSDAFRNLFAYDPDKQNRIKESSIALGIEDISAPDYINMYETSKCRNYIYLASESGFYVLDMKTGNILAFVPEEYGVKSFVEILPGLLALATWTGTKLYRLYDQ